MIIILRIELLIVILKNSFGFRQYQNFKETPGSMGKIQDYCEYNVMIKIETKILLE